MCKRLGGIRIRILIATKAGVIFCWQSSLLLETRSIDNEQLGYKQTENAHKAQDTQQ